MDLKIFAETIEPETTQRIYSIARHPAFMGATIRSYVPSGKAIQAEEKNFDKHLRCMRCYGDLENRSRILRSIGTLGGGNHFIELDKDGKDNLYLIIHTGSRDLGRQVAGIYQKEAEKNAHKCLKGTDALHYLQDTAVCTLYAVQNRMAIGHTILRHMGWQPTAPPFTTLHNYINEDGTIRKGAVSAKKGEQLLIPLNMRDGSLLCTGRGNPDWNCSAPHGAGRLISRPDAKELISLEEYRESMKDVWTTSVRASTIDESPSAYKDTDEIKSLIGHTVRIVGHLTPVYNFKAS